MRYLDEVTFIKESPDSRYDPDLGEWVEKNQLEQYLVQTSLILELTEVLKFLEILNKEQKSCE